MLIAADVQHRNLLIVDHLIEYGVEVLDQFVVERVDRGTGQRSDDDPADSIDQNHAFGLLPYETLDPGAQKQRAICTAGFFQ